MLSYLLCLDNQEEIRSIRVETKNFNFLRSETFICFSSLENREEIIPFETFRDTLLDHPVQDVGRWQKMLESEEEVG